MPSNRVFRSLGTAALVAVWACSIAGAQSLNRPIMDGKSPSELFPWAKFDPGIPTLKQVIGFDHGARPLRHAEMQTYLRALDEASPRARLIEYSKSHEGRAMVYLAVSDAATIADLDTFQREHAQRMDPRQRKAGDDAQALDGAKAVAWMAYSIHGDEISGSDSSAALAYLLVAGTDARTAALRDNLVVLIDPMQNPDGRDRYLAQIGSFAHATPNPDQEDLSHTGVWPWGRGNHYLFDLNRDFFSMVHPESKRATVIGQWNVQLAVDAHEMGDDSSFLFPPPRHPFNPLLPPTQREWWTFFAADQAAALDEQGYPYFTREWNEEFFPGYGSSWPAYHGALGVLYEMSGTSGTFVKKREGSVRTYPEAVEHQALSSVANLTTLSDRREEILRGYVRDRRSWVDSGGGGVGAWILPRGRHTDRTDALVRLLRDQGIEILRSEGQPKAGGLRDIYTGDSAESSALGEDAWMIPLDQPAGRLARVLLDPHVPMPAEFLREQREYLERDRGSRLYEVTAWSLIFNYGVEGYWTVKTPTSGWKPAAVAVVVGTVVAQADAVAYLIDGTTDNSVPALADLLQRGLLVKVAERPVTLREQTFGRGSLLLPVEGNPDDLVAQLTEVATRWSVKARAVASGLADNGPDLGGSHFKTLVMPRVAVLAGYPVSPTPYGAIWHLLDKKMGLRFSALDLASFGGVDLRRYNVLVFPPVFGGASGYRSRLGDGGIDRLKQWIKSGGTAIGVGNGAEFLADEELELTRARLRRQALEQYPPVVLGPSAEAAQLGGAFRAAGIAPHADDADGDRNAKAQSPYDVAPILGPGAAPFAAGVDRGTPVELKPVDLSEWLQPYLAPGKILPDKKLLAIADSRLRRFGPKGAFLRVELDPHVWLTWGLPDEIPALSRTSSVLVAVPPTQVAARFVDLERLHLGGLLWPEAAGRIALTAYATRESVGAGQVVLFIDEPEFRGWTLGTRRLLQNAVLYGPGLGTRFATPW